MFLGYVMRTFTNIHIVPSTSNSRLQIAMGLIGTIALVINFGEL
jgi:hypothetical protein